MTDITEDLYEVLGVDREASEGQIHEAYNKLFATLDEQGPNEEKKKMINRAEGLISFSVDVGPRFSSGL